MIIVQFIRYAMNLDEDMMQAVEVGVAWMETLSRVTVQNLIITVKRGIFKKFK